MKIITAIRTRLAKFDFKVDAHSLTLIIIGAGLIIMALALMPQKNQANTKPIRKSLTVEDVISNLKTEGYTIMEAALLDPNQTYTQTIPSDAKIKIVGSNSFGYMNNFSVPQEIIVENNEIVDVGEVKAPFTFTTRGLSGKTKIFLLQKTSNGIDPIKALVKPIAGFGQIIGNFFLIVFRVILMILGLLGFVLVLWGIVEIFFTKKDPAKTNNKNQPNDISAWDKFLDKWNKFLDKLLGPKKIDKVATKS